MENKKFTINSINPQLMVQNLIEIYEGKVEDGLVTFDNHFANGKFKYIDYDGKMVATINNIQYKKKVQFNFFSNEIDTKWITLLFNSQSCIIILNNISPREASYSNHGSTMNFKNDSVEWQPAFSKMNSVKTIVMFISVNSLEGISTILNGATQLKKSLETVVPVGYIKLDKSAVNILEDIFNMIEMDDNQPFSDKKLESYMWALAFDTLHYNFKHLEEMHKLHSDIQTESDQIKNKIIAAKDEMLRDFSRKHPDLDTLAKIASMNRTKFQTTFKDIFSVSFYQYYQEARFNEALRLLEIQSNTITSVANTVGYKNVGHFIKEFQKRFGLTPNEYKTKQCSVKINREFYFSI